jgi:DNA mismatch repair protein MutS2
LELIQELRAKGRAADLEELALIAERLRAQQAVLDGLRGETERAPRLARIAGAAPSLEPLLKSLDAVLDGDSVRDDASVLLQQLRREKRRMEIALRARMEELANGERLRAHLMERNVHVRTGRLVLAVRAEHAGQVPGLLHDRSASGSTVFIEPREILEQSNQLADINSRETRELARILVELTRLAIAAEADVAAAEKHCAWLEHSVARGRMSLAMDLRAPRAADELRLQLRDARHPLLLAESQRVGGTAPRPLQLLLDASRRVLVITGPNTGGKTVVLRTVGLIQAMFQSGLHVPAKEGSELPVLHDLLADIGDEQDLAQSLSTFSGHMRSVAPMLKNAGSRLLLIDELGSGTDPVEGAALGEALLEKVLASGDLCIVTTHLGMLKRFAFARPGAENAAMSFDAETLLPTYELVTGALGSSQALVVAERQGVPVQVIARARELLGDGREREGELMDALAEARSASERARVQAEAHVHERARELAAATEELSRAREERGRLEREAEAEVQRIITELRQAAEPHLAALGNVPPALKPHATALVALFQERLRFAAFAERRREFLQGLKRHDHVWVPRFGQTCRIEKLDRKSERLTVRVGAISMDVGFDDITFLDQPEPPQR